MKRTGSLIPLMVILMLAGYIAALFFIDYDPVSTVASTLVSGLGLIGVCLQLKKDSDIKEAEFLMQYNFSFLTTDKFVKMERRLEDDMTLRAPLVLTADDRQDLVDYLVYLESLAPLILNKQVRLDVIDDLFGYRYFIAVNNPIVQKLELCPGAEYYRGCFRVYQLWSKYRRRHGIVIPREEDALSEWSGFSKYAKSHEDISPVKSEKAFVVVRNLRPTDNLSRAAELLWLADRYIMDDLFGSRENAFAVGPTLFSSDPQDLFCFDRILVAVENGRLQGILCWRDGRCRWDSEKLTAAFAQSNVSQPQYFHRVNEQYFAKTACSEPSSGGAECIFLAVAESCRGYGLGEALLQQWLAFPQFKTQQLDVLKSNSAAISLYHRCGFTATEEFDAYPSKPNHRCLRMVRTQAPADAVETQ